MAKNTKVIEKGGAPAGFYFLTYIGAAIYFVDRADGFWNTIGALFQAMVWPAYLINRVFTILQIT